jgi:transposase
MAGERTTLDTIRDIILRLRDGQAVKQIKRETKLHRNTVRRYRDLARREGWLTGPVPELAAIEAALAKEGPAQLEQGKAEPYRAVVQALVEKRVEAMAIHRILTEGHGFTGSYSSVQRFVKRLRAVTPTAVLRMETAPGAEAQVDFGDGPRLVDAETGESKKTWVFVMVLSHSRHIYAELVHDQKVTTWLGCHRRAFEFFGGVPGKVVLDNLKAAIVQACWNDQQVQRAYRECGLYYDFLITPCRPATPQHKGKVESGVHYVTRNAMAGRTFKDLAAWNVELQRWCLEVAGKREHGTTKERPLDVFLLLEKPALKPLPEIPYEVLTFHVAKVHPDCHVIFDKAYYSAPHRLISQQVEIRATAGRVELYFEHQRIATHERAKKKGVRQTIAAHYPPEKLAGLLATPTRMKEQASQVGPSTLAVVERLLNNRPEDRMRSAMGILGQVKKFGADRLEAACKRALAYEAVGYSSIKSILNRKLDFEPLPQELFVQGPVPKLAAFARSTSDLSAHFERKTSWNYRAN